MSVHIVLPEDRTLQVGDLLIDLSGNICRVTNYYPYYKEFDAAYITNIHGAPGTDGKDYALTESDKTEIAGMVKNLFSGETWTFTLADGSAIEKEVPLL